ncbi:Satratoxin biosynthesis SC1 cluster protein 4 [Apiospora arundinis]
MSGQPPPAGSMGPPPKQLAGGVPDGGGGSASGGAGAGAALGGGNGLPPPVAPMDPAMFAALDHSTSTGPIIAVSIICILLSITAVTLRVYTRQFLLNRVGPDDFMAVAAMTGITALGAITIIHTQFGLGTHIYDIVATNPALIMEFFKFFYLGVVVYNVSLLFVKLSLFLQYYRLVDQVPRYRTLFLVAGFIVVGWTISMIFTMTFICIPVYAYWDKSVPNVCLSDPVMQLTNSIGNIATDVMLLLLPMPVLWNLKLPPRQKWSVIGIFSLGFLTCIVSLLRVIFVFDHGPSSDISFEGTTITGWTIAEVTTGLLASSLITLRPLMSKISPAAWRSRSGKSTGGTTTNNNKSNADPKSGAVSTTATTDKNGIADIENANDDPIQLHPVHPARRPQQQEHQQLDINYNLDRQQQEWQRQRRQKQQQQQQQQEQQRQREQENYGNRPYSDGELSADSSDVELVVQKNAPTPPHPTNRRKSRSNTLTSAPEGWGPSPPAPAFYFSEQQQQESQTQQSRRSQRQQDYQRHRQSRSANFFDSNNSMYDRDVIGSDQVGLATTTPPPPPGQGPPTVRNNQHRRHASSRSADRIISLHPSFSTASGGTPTPAGTLTPPPPPPKSPWALAAAIPPLPPLPPHMGGPLPPLPTGAGGLPRAPRPSVKHSKSQSSSSTRSDISYECKVWSQKGAGGPFEGVDDRHY